MDFSRERERIIRRGYDWYQENLGEVVGWFEYDAVNSEYHHVYDEPTQTATRKWRSVILVPTLWVNEEEDERRNDREGRLVTPSIRFAVPMRVLVEVGLSSPVDARRHLNDLVVYRGNYWTISDYQMRGRMHQHMIVGVTAHRVDTSDDMPFDVLPTIDGKALAEAPQGFPSNSFANQTFDEHELPAHHTPVFATPATISISVSQ